MRAPLTLGPSKLQLSVFTGLFLVTAGLGVGLCFEGGPVAIVGAVMVVLGGGLAAQMIGLLRPGVAELRLDALGITYRWGRRRGQYAWDDVEQFAVAYRGKNTAVGIRLRPHHPLAAQPPRLGYYHDHLDGYRLGVTRLAALLEAYRTAPEGEPQAKENGSEL